MQELSLNILDVAENSVRAGATLTTILVDEQPQQDLLTIQIADNGCGMSEEQVQRVTDPFFTTRTTRKVGLGVPLLKMAAELAGGSFSIRSKLGEGTTTTATFQLGHIDRMPLGDVAATICTLVQCNPEIDFVYTYRPGEREFSADTRQFRQILEGVPLSDPHAVTFLRGYTLGDTRELGG